MMRTARSTSRRRSIGTETRPNKIGSMGPAGAATGASGARAPAMKIWARSARSTISKRLTASTSPASPAMPESPALMAPSTVSGPMAGRSSRLSWSGFERLTSTPRRRLDHIGAARQAHVADARDHPVGAFRAFDGFDGAAGHDHRLADVVGAERGDEAHAGPDVADVGRLRRMEAERTFIDEQFRRHVRDAEHVQAPRLEKIDDTAQHRVVAAGFEGRMIFGSDRKKPKSGFAVRSDGRLMRPTMTMSLMPARFRERTARPSSAQFENRVGESPQGFVRLAVDHDDVHACRRAR